MESLDFEEQVDEISRRRQLWQSRYNQTADEFDEIVEIQSENKASKFNSLDRLEKAKENTRKIRNIGRITLERYRLGILEETIEELQYQTAIIISKLELDIEGKAFVEEKAKRHVDQYPEKYWQMAYDEATKAGVEIELRG